MHNYYTIVVSECTEGIKPSNAQKTKSSVCNSVCLHMIYGVHMFYSATLKEEWHEKSYIHEIHTRAIGKY